MANEAALTSHGGKNRKNQGFLRLRNPRWRVLHQPSRLPKRRSRAVCECELQTVIPDVRIRTMLQRFLEARQLL
jgi:hypothetical protein